MSYLQILAGVKKCHPEGVLENSEPRLTQGLWAKRRRTGRSCLTSYLHVKLVAPSSGDVAQPSPVVTGRRVAETSRSPVLAIAVRA